jgi:signal transduction histidine kinase
VNELGPAGRTPRLSQLVRAADLERGLAPLLGRGCDGIGIFDAAGVPHTVQAQQQSPLGNWEQLPVEATQVLRKGGSSFGIEAHLFDVRPLFAGADRMGVLVVARPRADASADSSVADALAVLVGQLLQAGFAAWVTSEMHLAASENSYREMSQQNVELQRAVEHLRELDKLKSNFLATVSHELRTPLTSVIGFAEMLLTGLAGDLLPEQREYVQTIFDRGEELLGLITQILEMSQLEVGAVRLDLQPVEVVQLLARAVDSVQLEADKANVTVRIADDVVDASALVDADKLQRVLVNLVGNAIKFTRDGGEVVLSAAAAPIRRPFEEETLFGEELVDAVRLTIADTGIGIPAEQLGRIFEAFYQVDAGPTREHGGAGLGLSIVRSLVTAHGGDVWADSVVGRGTCVHFTVPIATRSR